MPMMNEPLAHLSMLLDNTKARIQALHEQKIKVEASINELQNVRWELQNTLDEERKKLTSGEPQRGQE